MKRAILTGFVTLLLAVALLLILPGLLSPRAEAATAPTNNMYVAKNEAAGLMGDVLLFSKGSGKYALYLPGDAESGKLNFSWANSVTVTNESGVKFVSGKLSVPAPGTSEKYVVNGTTYTVETVQGSKDAKALFLETDTSLSGFYSFSEMNNSSDKSKAAAGTMAFDDVGGYYFSIKGRGNATWTSAKDKKGYNITLYKDSNYDNTKGFELIGGVKAKKWSLLANYYDSSLLRNKLAYDMAVSLGLGLESVFVDLWVDGQYRGNYLMTPKNDYNDPDNGYMLEIDNYTDANSFKLSGMSGRITVKENKAGVGISDIQAYMTKAWSAVKDETSEAYLDYIDLDSWAKFYLLHEFYMSFDVMAGSQFLYREGTTAADKLIAGPVWDMDNSMGKTQTWAGFGLSYDQQHSPLYDYIQSVNSEDFWLQELGQHESFMQRVHEIYGQYRPVFTGAANKMDTYQAQLESSALMNYHRWGYQSGRPKISSSDICGCVKTTQWSHYVANLRNYAVKRAAYLDETFPEVLSGKLRITGDSYPGATLIANVTDTNADTLVYTWQQGERTTVGGNRFLLREADYGKPVTCTVTSPDMVGSLTVTLEAVTVNLSYAGGTGGPDALALYRGLPYGQLPAPTKDGYEFLGWYTGPNGTGTKVMSYTEVPTASVYRLYAFWKEKEAPVIPTEPSPTEKPAQPTAPPTQPTEVPTSPTVPVETTAPTEAPTVSTDAPSVPTTVPAEPTTVPTTQAGTVPPFSQIPIVGTDGTTAEMPGHQETPSRLNIWYILAPAGALVLLLIFLLVWKKRKKT